MNTRKHNHYSKPRQTATHQLSSTLCHALQERAAFCDALLKRERNPVKRAEIKATFEAGDQRLIRAYASGRVSSDLRRFRVRPA